MKLLGLGDNVMDAYLFRGELYPGGNAANVAVLAKRAGAEKSGYIGVLATDVAGEHFRTVLQAENVDISRLRRGVGRTACNYITLDDQGDRAFSGNNGQETVQNLYRPIITSADRMYAATFDVVHSSIHSGLDDALPTLSHCADLSMDFSSDGFTHDNVARLAPLLRFAFFRPVNAVRNRLWSLHPLPQSAECRKLSSPWDCAAPAGSPTERSGMCLPHRWMRLMP